MFKSNKYIKFSELEKYLKLLEESKKRGLIK